MSSSHVYRALCVHWDHHPTKGTPHYGAGADAEQIRRYLRAVKPDVTQYHTIGAEGYVNFPSRVAPVVPGLVGDPPAVWARVCAEEGVAFGCYAASFACEYPAPVPQWRCVTRAGKEIAFYCPNGPWTEEFFVPLLEEIIERYHPVHFWLDGTWLPYLRDDYCFCAHCRRRYSEQFGRDLPPAPKDSDWVELQEFYERSLDEAIARIARAIKAHKPGIQLACNTLYYFRDMRTPIPEVDWLSWDLINRPDLDKTVCDATYLATAGKPADMMIYEKAIVQWEPFLSRPRTSAQLKTESAILLSRGVRVNLWQDPLADGAVPDEKAVVAGEVAAFVRERQAWCVDNDSAAEVALLGSRFQHNCDGWQQERILRAACKLLQAEHIPCDIVREDTWLQRRTRYRLVILPEINILNPALVESLRDYVERGGALLWVATELLLYSAAWPQALLGEFGVLTSSNHSSVIWDGNSVPLGRRRFALPAGWRGIISYEGVPDPWLAEISLGAGRVVALASETISDYGDHYWPRLRNLAAAAVRHALGGALCVELDGHPGIDVTVNRRGADLYAHFVNITPGNSFGPAPSGFFFDETPVYRKLKVRLRLPRAPAGIVAMPGEIPLKARRRNEVLEVVIPELQRHVALRLIGCGRQERA